MYSQIIKNIVFPMYQIKLPRNERYTTYMKLLDKTQWWSYSDLERFQLQRLKNILKHANDNVPFYHIMFKQLNFKPENVTNVSDLKKLPILTKEIIKNNFDELYARNYQRENFIPSTTGGSTGVPLKFYIDRRWDACNMAAAFRSWNWAGYKPGDKKVYLWGAHQDLKNSSNIDKIRNYLLRIRRLDAFNLTEENMEKYINILRQFKPKVINSYASAAFTLSKYMNERNISDIKPQSIITTADMLYDYKRKSIEQVFDCNVFDYYSGRDTSLQAAECCEHAGYHLSIENAVVEFLKQNEPVSSGETGKIIITDLCNYAMPFIRYEIGDLGIPSNEICSCGRKLPLMKSIKGRILDSIVTPEGKILTGEFFPAIFADYDIKGIDEFQIIQKKKDKLLIKLIKGKNYSEKNLDFYIKIIKKNVGDQMEIEIQFVEKIEPTPSGKQRPVISEIQDEYKLEDT